MLVTGLLATLLLAVNTHPVRPDDPSGRVVAMAPTSALVSVDGDDIVAFGADTPHAVGSAFKIAVLVALDDAIDRGLLAWDDVVRLEPAAISLPTGLLQDLPPGSPLTVHSLAILMIAVSDNTATDMLIGLLGRDAVEAVLGQPILTTREFFQLKAEPELADGLSDPDERAEILADLAANDLPETETAGLLWNPAIEWLIANRTLCELIEAVSDLDVFRVNPGLADPEQWKSVAYKGGGETGVLNLTTYLIARSGERICVSMTWNRSQAIDPLPIYDDYAALLASMAD